MRQLRKEFVENVSLACSWILEYGSASFVNIIPQILTNRCTMSNTLNDQHVTMRLSKGLKL